MAWNQPGGTNNNNPWGKKPGQGGDFDQAFKDWQKRIEAIFGGGSGERSGGAPILYLVILIVGVWALTGFYQIKTGERGVVQRFGQHVGTVGDGVGWRLPWPIETVTKVDVEGVKNEDYKSRVLTAEPNMVELQIAVQYRIQSPEDYLFRVRDPDDTLREVSESAIREVVGRSNQDAILGGQNRLRIADETHSIMQRALDQYGAGLQVVRVNITDVQVPEAVQAAQRDSVKAGADKDRMIKEAEAYRAGIIPVAEGAAARSVQEAEAYKSQVIAMATGEASRFAQLAAAYERSPGVTRERLYIEAVETVMKSSRKVIIDAKSGSNGNMIYLPLDKLVERTTRGDTDSGATVRPQVTVESESSTNTDPRARGDR
jgi:membrane protease subunit HflK